MLKHRVIPVLLFDGSFCVHTTKFNRLRRLGPIEQYTNNMANRDIDELILLDIKATPQGRAPKFDMIKRFTEKLMCPVAYGGGIRDVGDINTLIKNCGVDKVIIKTNYNLIHPASHKYGKQAIVYALDVHNNLVAEAIKWAKLMEAEGCGEMIVTDVNHQGTMQGYNNLLINSVSKELKIPVVANGGCGGIGDMIIALSVGANAVAASSAFTIRGLTPQDASRGLQRAGIPARVSPTASGQEASQRPPEPEPGPS